MDLEILLRERQLKVTTTRLKVLSVISDYSKAIPYAEIQKSLADFDRVTLYRTLNTLIESGIVHKAAEDKNETFYALCSSSCTTSGHSHQHFHFRCTSCHEVSCVQSVETIHLAIPGHQIDSFEIEAAGVCKSCNS